MEGIALLLSMVCINTTFCPSSITSPGVNLIENKLEANGYDNGMEELAKELKGKTLRVVTLEDWPLSYTERVNGTFVGRGQAFEFFEMLMEKFEFNYTIVRPKYNIIGSTGNTDGSLISTLLEDKADVAVAFIPRIADILEHIDVSNPLDEGEWKMIMRRPQESATGAGLLAPFSDLVWIYILITLIVCGPLVWFIILIYQRLFKRLDPDEPYFNLFQCCWFVYGGLMKQGSVLSPSANSIRVAFGSWWIYITIVTSFYTANLTAFLTLAKFSLPINEPRDLLDKRHHFICQKGFGFDYSIMNRNEELSYLKPLVDKNLVKFVTENNDTDILLKDVWENDFIFIRDWPALGHLVYNDYRGRKMLKQERLQCPFATSKKPSLRRMRGFAYPKFSKWKKLFDPTIAAIFESGIVRYRLNDGLPRAEICPQNLGSTERQLRLNDLWTTYLTMIIGFSCGAAVFFGELFVRWFNARKRRQLNGIGRGTTVIRTVKEKPRMRDPHKQTSKIISPPPAYGEAIKTIFNTKDDGKVEGYRTFNGRTYAIVRDASGTQMVPTRTPSAALFNYQLAYNN